MPFEAPAQHKIQSTFMNGNTSSKGMAFEMQVKAKIEQCLTRRDFGIDPAHAHVFHRKAYFSTQRDANIVVDLSIEVYRPTASEPFFVWIWECKDYQGAVPVDDIEEFHAKLQQIGADKTKGTVITSNAFQRAAVAYARSNGIGLVRLFCGELTFELESRGVICVNDQIEGLCGPSPACTDLDAQGISERGVGITGFEEFIRTEMISLRRWD